MWWVRSFVLQHPPALLDITQATGEMGIQVSIEATAFFIRTHPGEGNSSPPQVTPLAISTANAVPGAYWPPERKLLNGPSTFLWRLSVTLQVSSLVHCHTQLVPYNWYCCRVFPRDSSLKTLNCFPKVSGFSARAWSPRHPRDKKPQPCPPCLEATMMLTLQPEWTQHPEFPTPSSILVHE